MKNEVWNTHLVSLPLTVAPQQRGHDQKEALKIDAIQQKISTVKLGTSGTEYSPATQTAS